MNYAAFDISRVRGGGVTREGLTGVATGVCRGAVSGAGGDRGTVTGVGMGVVENRLRDSRQAMRSMGCYIFVLG
jgi:hypothetical protein